MIISYQSFPTYICQLVLRPDLTSFFSSQGLFLFCVHDFRCAIIVIPQKNGSKKRLGCTHFSQKTTTICLKLFKLVALKQKRFLIVKLILFFGSLVEADIEPTK